MKKLRSVNGYLGSAILNVAGESLYVDEENTGVDIAYAASVFNNTFGSVSEASVDIGFSDASFIEIRTHDGHIFLLNSIENHAGENFSKVNIFAVFRDDGNIALAKMLINRTSKSISKELSEI